MVYNFSSRKNGSKIFNYFVLHCKKGGALYRKAFHYFQLHRDEFDKRYHKRSNAESTFAAIKQKFGDSLKSRNKTAQVNEMFCNIIAYNITVLIRVMFKLGIHPEFNNKYN